jgi:hypothetical protein
MNLALRLALLLWVVGYLVVSCAPILNGHLILGAIGVFGGIIFFVPWVIGIVVLVFLISATNPPRR